MVGMLNWCASVSVAERRVSFSWREAATERFPSPGGEKLHNWIQKLRIRRNDIVLNHKPAIAPVIPALLPEKGLRITRQNSTTSDPGPCLSVTSWSPFLVDTEARVDLLTLIHDSERGRLERLSSHYSLFYYAYFLLRQSPQALPSFQLHTCSWF